jgi:hypothetical protein
LHESACGIKEAEERADTDGEELLLVDEIRMNYVFQDRIEGIPGLDRHRFTQLLRPPTVIPQGYSVLEIRCPRGRIFPIEKKVSSSRPERAARGRTKRISAMIHSRFFFISELRSYSNKGLHDIVQVKGEELHLNLGNPR